MNISVIIVYTLMTTIDYKVKEKQKHEASRELWYFKLSPTHYTSSQPDISCEK